MKWAFWRKHKIQELEALEKVTAKTHQQNINKITQARKKSDTLKEVLKENNITIELAKAIGH